MDQPLALIVSPDPGGRLGGVERFCELVGNVMTRAGWRTEEVGPQRTPSLWVRRLGGSSIANSRSTAAAIARRQPDLIVSNGELGSFSPPVPRIHAYLGTMVADSVFGDVDLPVRERIRRLVGDGIAEAAAGRGATTVAISHLTAAEIRRYYRLRVDAVVYPGVDVERFRPRDRAEARRRLDLPPDARLALFSGRLEGRKGSDLLLPSCDAAGFELVVAGPRAPQGGGRYLGFLEYDRLPWAYAAADCLLFPTRYEGFGFVTHECLACEVPVVTTWTGYVPSLVRAVPSYRPLVVRPELADVVRGLREHDRHADAVRLAAEEIRTNNTIEVFTRRWLDMVERTAPDAARRASAHAGRTAST